MSGNGENGAPASKEASAANGAAESAAGNDAPSKAAAKTKPKEPTFAELGDDVTILGKSGLFSWYSIFHEQSSKKFVTIDLVSLHDIWFSQESITLNSEDIHTYFQKSEIDCVKIEESDSYLLKGFFGWEIKTSTKGFIPLYIPTIEIVEFNAPCPHYTSLNNRRLYLAFIASYCKLTNPELSLKSYTQRDISEIMRLHISGKTYNYMKDEKTFRFENALKNIFIPCIIHKDYYDSTNILNSKVGDHLVQRFKKKYVATETRPAYEIHGVEPPGSYGNMIAIRSMLQPTFAHTMFYGVPLIPATTVFHGQTRQHVLEPVKCLEGDIRSISSYTIKFPTQASGKLKHTKTLEREAYAEMNRKFTKAIQDLTDEGAEVEEERYLPGIAGGYRKKTRKHKKHRHPKKRYGQTKKLSVSEPSISDIVEIIHKRSNIVFQDAEKAKEYLSRLDADIRLDLHGVLDILSDTEPLLSKDRSKYKICVLSFVGATGAKRTEAKEDIKKRIVNKQVEFGVLVFRRGRGRDKFTFVEAGSKAWTNNAIGCNRLDTCLFIDDSTDHLRSTKHLCEDKIETQLFNTGKPEQLKALLAKYVESHNE
jgi:hypothetical protein